MFGTTPFFPTGPPFGIGEFVVAAALSMLLADDSPILSQPINIEGDSFVVAEQVMDKRPDVLQLRL